MGTPVISVMGFCLLKLIWVLKMQELTINKFFRRKKK